MRAIILFGHGARDDKWRKPFDQLCDLWKGQYPGIPVELAFLEMMRPTLSEAMGVLSSKGVTKISVVPIFFGQGGHLCNDFPVLISECREIFPNLVINATKAVGEDSQVLQSIVDYAKRNCNEA